MKNKRIRSIDIFRALTMFFMIFVNDLWSLTGVPEWLEHAAVNEDRMGFSDIIFPLFLFIVGLSIPLAVRTRLKKGTSHWSILKHIILRTVALLTMGFYMVNFEMIYDDAMPINKHFWEILMALAICLIWLDFKGLPSLNRQAQNIIQAIGVLLLIFLAAIYKGGSAEDIVWMRTSWWGILGLIGWAYFLNSIIYLLFQKIWPYLFLVFLLFLFMNIQENGYYEHIPSITFIISASNYALVMAGVLCTCVFLHFRKKEKESHFLKIVLGAGILFIIYGFMLRELFPISKIKATPTWSTLCIGIGYVLYVFFYILVDKLNIYKWADPFKPAGTSTLTCYLMPYFIYPIIILIGFDWPSMMTTGIAGIIKSLLFSFVIILFVGWMEKRGFRLKI
ncbi:heparan-alpha-glucosaminide N-acetyltransferase domain-containing protein [Zhouia amylolytica]|nr:DUF5009 domain-containing protein [Zhouia amylolytica]